MDRLDKDNPPRQNAATLGPAGGKGAADLIATELEGT